MNYRHGYHAGNFCDVFKHTLLMSLLKSLQKKDSAFGYLDTHAGSGSYDLNTPEAKKSREFEKGIKKIWQADNPPPLIQEYLSYVSELNPNKALRFYPGSPMIAAKLLRAQDRAVLIEKHPSEQRAVRRLFLENKKIHVHFLDAYQSLKAFLPLTEKRGLTFIDPPYEQDDIALLTKALPLALQRFETGTYAIWYPIKQKTDIEKFYKKMRFAIQRPLLVAELCLYPPDSPLHLNGCGMIIVNPPWQLKSEINTYLPWIWETLSIDGEGHHRIFKYE